MPDAKKLREPTRPEKELAGTKDNYNPVNMAGKKAEKREEPPQNNTPKKDNYNPVNMAGKKADTRKGDAKQKPSERGEKAE